MTADAGSLGVIVLAAGQGTRMKSALPKVLHPVCGTAMGEHVLNAARPLSPAQIAVVVGHLGDQVREGLTAPDITFVEQTELLGTGDAVRRCRAALSGVSRVMVLNGDCPLIRPELLRALLDASAGNTIAFATCTVADPGRLGRVSRDASGAVTGITEAADYEGPTGPAEINAGQYVFDAAWLWEHAERIPKSAKGEYYLTHLLAMAHAEGRPGISIDSDAAEVLGVDDRVRLAEAEAHLRQRILKTHMLNGVTITDPATTYIDAAVTIAEDVTILPGCHLLGRTAIETDTVIGPGSTLRSAIIGPGTTVQTSVIEDSTIGANVTVGPFAHVRGGANIGDDCQLGNYAEVKNSVFGRGVKMHHFGYMGDANVGEYTNIAAGAITCNWDGVSKHRTTIGANVFIGCDTMLVAPVTLGDGAFTATGAVVTKDVPAGERVAGVPARPMPRRPKDEA